MSRRILLICVAILLAATVGGLLWVHATLYRDAPTGETARVEIAPGTPLGRIARDLERRGLLDAAWQLRLVARLEGGAERIRAGEYDLPRGSSPARLLEIFVEGRQRLRSVTLVEGLRFERSVEVLADSLALPADSLAALVRRPRPLWRQALGLEEGRSLEGYLFPETYHFAARTPAEEVVGTLVESFTTHFDASLRERARQIGWSVHEVVTLASIVEAEAVFDEERPRVAAVYRNRLEQGWKLEADPTVAYALGKEGERLLFRDLEVDSAYNTYVHAGLPPGPINSPGLASMRAVLWPEPGFDALYFVADGRGGHVFSETWQEHRRAVEAYRRHRREAADGGG